jgi:hypothetical protein
MSCGRNNQLFDLGREIPVAGGMAQLCLTCAKEIALFIGYAEKAPLDAEIAQLKTDIVSRETEIAVIPNHTEELINGIRRSLTDFIFAISYSDHTDKSAPVQDDSEPDSGEHEASEVAAGKRKAPVKPTSK